MNDKPTLLCVCQYQPLLDTRVAVLSKSYSVFPVGSLDEMASLPAGICFDLVLLCHTLPKEDCAAARLLILQRWLGAKVLNMTKTERSCAADDVTPVRGLDGPAALLQRLEALVHPVEPDIRVVATPLSAHL